MTVLRVVIVAIVVAIVAVTLVPMVVLVDLASGGDGLGLCEEGIRSCRTSYFDGPELVAGLLIAAFVLMLLLRLAVNALRAAAGRREREALERSVRRGDGLRGG